MQHFDSTIKAALDNYEVPYDPGTWAALESRLDALPAADALDKAVKPTLERAEMRYDPQSWAALSQKMDSRLRAKRLRMTKLAEAAILLLLLLNLEGVLGVCNKIKPALMRPAPSPQKPIATTGPKAKPGKKMPSGTHMAALAAATGLHGGHQAEASPDNAQEARPAGLAAPFGGGSLLDAEAFYQQSGLIQFNTANLPVPAPTAPLPYAWAEELETKTYAAAYKKTGAKTLRYTALHGTFDQNHIRENTYRDHRSQWGAGIAVGRRKGAWGLETGLAYAQKNYRPERKNIEYDNDPVRGISFYNISAVEADVVSVPLKATRRVAKAGKFSAHAVAGVSAHCALVKSYGYETVTYPPVNPIPSPNPSPAPNTAFPAGKGVLQGGGLKQNVYASADLGLRLEHSLGKSCTAFVEPSYRQHLGGSLGPRTAQISTFSLQAGVMASL